MTSQAANTLRRRRFSRSKTSLAIVERAYRAPLEEQYGHILWLSRVLRKMKGEHDILLKGQAVMYARNRQQNVSLEIGGLSIRNLSDYRAALSGFIKQGGNVFAYEKDLVRYSMQDEILLDGIRKSSENDLLRCFEEYDCVWYW